MENVGNENASNENVGIRINRITVNIDAKINETTISLYKTNQLLGVIEETELGIETFRDSGVSVKAYSAYCKDVVISLIDSGGVSGYYYEPKSETSENIKYDMGLFTKKCMEYVEDTMDDKVEFKPTLNNKILTHELYNDKYIKNATASFEVKLSQYDILIYVIGEIKSGQLCRPKIMEYDGIEYMFNITNIKRIIRTNG